MCCCFCNTRSKIEHDWTLFLQCHVAIQIAAGFRLQHGAALWVQVRPHSWASEERQWMGTVGGRFPQCSWSHKKMKQDRGQRRRKKKVGPRSADLLYVHKAQRERINKALLFLLLLLFFYNSFSQLFFFQWDFFHLPVSWSFFIKNPPCWDALGLKND